MSGAECSRMELLLQADHDGELDVAATAELAEAFKMVGAS